VSRRQRKLLGVAATLPLAAFLVGGITAQLAGPALPTQLAAVVIVPTLVGSFIALVLLVSHALRNEALTPVQRWGWVAAILVFSLLAPPVYWWLHVRWGTPLEMERDRGPER